MPLQPQDGEVQSARGFSGSQENRSQKLLVLARGRLGELSRGKTECEGLPEEGPGEKKSQKLPSQLKGGCTVLGEEEY
jgi:hypothetical protein